MFPKDTKILIVDPDVGARHSLNESLGALGYEEIIEVGGSDEAWTTFEEAGRGGTPFHLILTDWDLQKAQGTELLEKVRGAEGSETIAFVLLATCTHEDQKGLVDAIRKGASAIMLKALIKPNLKKQLEDAYRRANHIPIESAPRKKPAKIKRPKATVKSKPVVLSQPQSQPQDVEPTEFAALQGSLQSVESEEVSADSLEESMGWFS